MDKNGFGSSGMRKYLSFTPYKYPFLPHSFLCWEEWSFWIQMREKDFPVQSLLLFSHSFMSDSLPPHGLQHARLPCPSPSPRACSNSSLSISSSVIPFSSCLQSFPSSASFSWGALVSHCSGFSCCRTEAPGHLGITAVACGLRSCRSQTLEHRLNSYGSWMGLVTPRQVESSWIRDQSCVSCIGRWILYH